MRVLVTGAEGTIGTAVREHLGDRYELHCLTHRSEPFASHVADIADLDAIRPAFHNMDAVVHLAATSSVGSAWDDLLNANLIGTYNVYEAARQAGVATVVFASSNHAIGMYERDGAPGLYEVDDPRVYDHTVEVRPDSLYGVSKVYGEALGRYFMEQHGLRVFCLRIGWVTADDDPRSPAVAEGSHWPLAGLTREQKLQRMAAVWLSRRDCAELIARCLEADEVRWALVYGVSDNPGRFWDIEQARKLLGWVPQDEAPE